MPRNCCLIEIFYTPISCFVNTLQHIKVYFLLLELLVSIDLIYLYVVTTLIEGKGQRKKIARIACFVNTLST